MLKHERQKKLQDLLLSKEIMTVAELSCKLDASMMTIRRDIDDLDGKGIVRKIHGGAYIPKNEMEQPSFRERIGEFDAEKDRIGKAAASLIDPGDIVFFDAGTTPLYVVDHLPDELEFTAITTGLMTALALCGRSGVNVINIGGNIHKSSYSSTSHLSVEIITRFNADKAFISTKAFSFPEGTFESMLPLIEIKKAIVSVSREVILLADHSKFETKSLCLAIPLGSIGTLITDGKAPAAVTDALRSIGKKVIIV
jgi:DeoR/GlpR family transcriptional regulator of sugar metabolism